MATVQRLIWSAFARYSGRPCLVWEGGSATYAETERRVRSLALALRSRTPDEGHVGILLPNGRAYLELILACAASGRVRVPFGEREADAAIAQKLATSQCRILFTTADWRDRLSEAMGNELPPAIVVDGSAHRDGYDAVVASQADESLAEANRSQRYRLSFTGGTTGAAKAVVQTHRQELALIRNLLVEVYQPGLDRVFVAATPLAHASGTFVVPTFLGGGSLSWTARFDAERLADPSWLGAGRRIQTFVVPTALGDLADAARSAGAGLETVVYGGAPCPASVLARAVEAIGPRLVQLYGQAEAPMTICVLPREDHMDPAQIAGCSGYPFLWVDVALENSGRRVTTPGDVGDVVVRSDHIMDGYWRDEDATAERFTADGGVRTQDVGRWDEHGRLWLVGRTREMLISGGYNVFPGEVERRLGQIEGVRELAAFGVPHPRWGEATVVAVVASRSAPDTRVVREVERAANDRLASYERPKRVLVVDELPLTAIGKVSRRDLADRFKDLFREGEHG